MVNYVQDTILLGPQLALGTLEQKTLEGNTTLLIAKKDQKISALDLKNARAVLFPTLVSIPGTTITRQIHPLPVPR